MIDRFDVENRERNQLDKETTINNSLTRYLTALKINRITDSYKNMLKFKYCRNCNQVKPPRAHHCSLCDRCVQKMDHHCPWVGTCVGFRNHKLFALFLVYTFIGLGFAGATMGRFGLACKFDTEFEALVNQDVILDRTLVFVIISLVLIFLFIFGVASLSGVHCYFVCRSLSTVEVEPLSLNGSNPFETNAGCLSDSFKAHFGTNPLIWLLPIPPAFDDVDGMVWKLRPTPEAENLSAIVAAVDNDTQRQIVDDDKS